MKKTERRNEWCIVPMCTNTKRNSVNKIFLRVPNDVEKRKIWLLATRRDPTKFSNKTVLFVCEDHFNIEDDMENYFQFKMMGGRKRLKPDVIPHKFSESTEEQSSSSAVELEENTHITSSCSAGHSKKRQSQKEDETTIEESKKIKEDVTEIKEEPLDIKEELIAPDKSDIHNQKPFELNFESINFVQETTSNLNTKPSNIDAYRNVLPSIKTESISDDVVAQYNENNTLEPVATILLPSIKRENCEAENYFDENEDPLYK